jgi:hypothetical protein
VKVFGNEILSFIGAVQIGVDLKTTQIVRVYRLSAYFALYRHPFVPSSELLKQVFAFQKKSLQCVFLVALLLSDFFRQITKVDDAFVCSHIRPPI